MQTTAGSSSTLKYLQVIATLTVFDNVLIVLVGATVPEEAEFVTRLRKAGAVLPGHANLSEWSSIRSSYYCVDSCMYRHLILP